MGLAHFLTYRGPSSAAGELASWFRDGPAVDLAQLPGVDYLDIYRPSRVDHTDPYVDDRDAPIMIAQTGHQNVSTLEATLSSPALAAAADLGSAPGGDLRLTHDAMAQEFFAVGDDNQPRPMAAPLSFVVRYHGPCEDPAVFTEHYRAGHATALARLPGIRNVLVYARIDWSDPTSIERADYLLGNEVVFDSIEGLNTALNSPMRHELRKHYDTFPDWTGHNTHYAMDRERLSPTD